MYNNYEELYKESKEIREVEEQGSKQTNVYYKFTLVQAFNEEIYEVIKSLKLNINTSILYLKHSNTEA